MKFRKCLHGFAYCFKIPAEEVDFFLEIFEKEDEYTITPPKRSDKGRNYLIESKSENLKIQISKKSGRGVIYSDLRENEIKKVLKKMIGKKMLMQIMSTLKLFSFGCHYIYRRYEFLHNFQLYVVGETESIPVNIVIRFCKKYLDIHLSVKSPFSFKLLTKKKKIYKNCTIFIRIKNENSLVKLQKIRKKEKFSIISKVCRYSKVTIKEIAKKFNLSYYQARRLAWELVDLKLYRVVSRKPLILKKVTTE